MRSHSRRGRRGHRRGGVAVVDDHQPAPLEPGQDVGHPLPRPGPGSGSGRPTAASGARPGRPTARRSRRPTTPTRRSTSRAGLVRPATPTASSCQPSAVRSTRPKARLSSSSLASTTPVSGPRRQLGRTTRPAGPAPVAAPGDAPGVGPSGRCRPRWSPWWARRAGRALDQHVAQRRARRRGSAASTARASVPAPGAGLDHGERIGAAQLVPPGVEGPGQHGAEQRPDLGAGQEVARAGPARPPRGVEAVVGVVERAVDHLVERQRALAADLVDQRPLERVRAPATLGRRPPTVRGAKVTVSVKWVTAAGNTPQTRVTATVRTSADGERRPAPGSG